MNTEKKRINLLDFIKKYKYEMTLACILILSFGLNFYAISANGTANEYYSAAIKSMTMSFKNFFFVAFDPSGMVSVDKPPLGFWIQAVFVLIFGYHGWAMMLPQALAGTFSCFMMYRLVGRYFPKGAALISALTFALTPIVVAVSRNNTIDMQLIFCLLLATDFLFSAIQKGKWRYLFIASIFIGLGFNIKMLQAYLIIPAFAAVYLIFAKEKLVKRFIAGIISMVLVFAVSFAWVFAVDLYPSNSRPYVDSSTNNTVTELILGHNGLERIQGQGNGGGMGQKGEGGNGPSPGGTPPQNGNMQAPPNMGSSSSSGTTASTNKSTTSNTNTNTEAGTNTSSNGSDGQMRGMPSGSHDGTHNGQGGGGMDNIGSTSIVRMWTSNLFGQASWLFAFCFIAILAFMLSLIKNFKKKQRDMKQCSMVFWTLWFLTMFVFFSFAGFYHRYYLCMFAPGVAALTGIGLHDAFLFRLAWTLDKIGRASCRERV